MCHVSAMANDIHIFLSDEEAAKLRTLAKREDRSLNNTGRLLIRRGLAADPDLTEETRTKRGRPAKPRHDLAEQVRVLGADSLLPK